MMKESTCTEQRICLLGKVCKPVISMIIPSLASLLGGIFYSLGYLNSLHPTANVHSAEMLYLVPRILMGILAVADTSNIQDFRETLFKKCCTVCICTVCSYANYLAYKKNAVRFHFTSIFVDINTFCHLCKSF